MPIKKIVVEEKTVLRDLLEINGVLEDVEAGRSIVLAEGKSLKDLETVVSPGNNLVVVTVGALGGG
jgi:hypothetical protein